MVQLDLFLRFLFPILGPDLFGGILDGVTSPFATCNQFVKLKKTGQTYGKHI
jgi:hypothetical protein